MSTRKTQRANQNDLSNGRSRDNAIASKNTAPETPLNPRTRDMEFFGPIGTATFTLLLPLTVLLLGSLGSRDIPESFGAIYTNLKSDIQLFRPVHLIVYLAWFLVQLVLYYIVPGKWVNGVLLRNNTQLQYKINAFTILLLTHGGFLAVLYHFSFWPFLWIAEEFVPLAVAASLYSIFQSLLLYVVSFRSDKVLLSEVGNAGNFFHDFWMGRELNPRISCIDFKFFCELRPGMFLWGLLNFSHVVKQYVESGSVSDSMTFVYFAQLLYIADSVWFENAILTTMDITTDGFGYMLTFGDLVWVPFTFSLQTRYLSTSTTQLSTPFLGCVVVINFIAYYIFRMSNLQKNTFRSDPNCSWSKTMKYIKTESGSRLLISGWWGLSRHANYFGTYCMFIFITRGDWMMGLAWCLCTGFDSPIPYFYVLYFGFLLIHRASRDDHKCRKKYAKDWEKYCKIVPSRIIPYIY